MKTAICFTGTGRSIDHTFWNLKDTIMNEEYVGERDVFVYVADGETAKKTKEKFESLDNTNVFVVKEEVHDTTEYRWAGGWPPHAKPKSIGRNIFLNMIKSRSIMNNILDEHEHKTNTKYDRVIFSRMDVHYKSNKAKGKTGPYSDVPLVFTPFNDYIDGLDMKYVWLPHFHHWGGGYNDRFAIGTRENMRHYFSLYDNIDLYKGKIVFQAENLLKYHIDRTPIKDKIKICWLPFCRIRSTGKHRDDWDDVQEATDMPKAKRQRKLDYIGPGTCPHGKPVVSTFEK